jgi:D-alanyl-D-alanine carboxypeptidase
VADLDALAEAARTSGAPGLVVARREANGTRFGSAGLADIDSDTRPGAATQFNVGSVGKTFTAALVLALVNDGQLDLDEPVERHLAEVSVGPTILLRHLLQHTSGLRDFFAEPEFQASLHEDPGKRWAIDDLLELALRGPPEPPGTRWSYSNTNYVLLWLLIERVGGSPLPDQLRERLTAPLGLNGTGFGRSSASSQLARGYMPAENPFRPAASGLVDATALTASLGYPDAFVSTPGDVARFLEALLGGTLLPPKLRSELLDAVPASGVECDAYGLGIELISSLFGTTSSPCGSAWGHLGLTPGYTTIALSREDGTRQVVLVANAGFIGTQAWEALAGAAWTAFCED